MKEIRKSKKKKIDVHYISVTTNDLNHLLDGCEDTLNIITRNRKIVSREYRRRLKILKRRIEDILKVED